MLRQNARKAQTMRLVLLTLQKIRLPTFLTETWRPCGKIWKRSRSTVTVCWRVKITLSTFASSSQRAGRSFTPPARTFWICEEGSAVAVTGGKLVNPKKPSEENSGGTSIFGNDTSGSSIEGGTEQAFQPGDILYVPPGVPHTFKDMKGFRAYLVRFDVR